MSEAKPSMQDTDAPNSSSSTSLSKQESLPSLEQEERRILRKVDARLMPYVMLLYFLANLDRTNVGQAQVDGLESDLHLQGQEYNIALSLFFVPYVIFELVVTVGLRHLRPNLWIPSIVVAWSIVTALMGLSKNFSGFVAARWFLGLAESGLVPNINLLIASYYTASHVNLRVGLFFSASSLAGAFGGLLASGIVQMRGIAGQHGWQWLFYLEGIFTLLCAIPGYWIIPNFADQHTRGFLTPKEKEIWNDKLVSEKGFLRRFAPFTWSQMGNVFTDWKTYVYGLCYLSISTVGLSYAYFLPIIVRGLGFTGVQVYLLTAPPNIFGAIVTIAASYYSDRKQVKGPFIILLMCIVSVGGILLVSPVPYSVSYFATFLVIGPLNGCISILIAWLSSNSGPTYGRAASLGWMIMFGNTGGIISTNIFRSKDAPRYILGNSIALGFAILAIICTAVLTFELKRLNRKRDALSPSEITRLLESMTEVERQELGDRHPHFRYVI